MFTYQIDTESLSILFFIYDDSLCVRELLFHLLVVIFISLACCNL